MLKKEVYPYINLGLIIRQLLELIVQWSSGRILYYHTMLCILPPHLMLYNLLQRVLYKPLLSQPHLSISQHIFHKTEVSTRHMLLNLLPCQPLEILQPKHIVFDIRLSSHNPCLHEERLLTWCFKGGLCRVPRFLGVVAYGGVAYNPGVHVQARCLN